MIYSVIKDYIFVNQPYQDRAKSIARLVNQLNSFGYSGRIIILINNISRMKQRCLKN